MNQSVNRVVVCGLLTAYLSLIATLSGGDLAAQLSSATTVENLKMAVENAINDLGAEFRAFPQFFWTAPSSHNRSLPIGVDIGTLSSKDANEAWLGSQISLRNATRNVFRRPFPSWVVNYNSEGSNTSVSMIHLSGRRVSVVSVPQRMTAGAPRPMGIAFRVSPWGVYGDHGV